MSRCSSAAKPMGETSVGPWKPDLIWYGSAWAMTFENGLLHPSDTPGLGVTFHPEVAEKFPYEQAYLPYNRLADGTVHNW